MPPFPRAMAVLCLAALSTCTCGKKPPGHAPLALEPLPEPPKITVEALPGEGPDLAVVATRPQGPVKGNFHPSITFNKPIMALEAVSDLAGQPPPAIIDPPIPGTWRWLGSGSVELIPAAPVPLATHFKVTIPAGLKALDGSTLAKDHSFEFETPRPDLQSVVPDEHFRWLKADASFTLVFNQEVKDLAAKAWLEVGPRQEHVAMRVASQEKPQNAGKPLDFISHQVRYVLQPEKALPLDAQVELVVDRGLEGEGPLITEAPIRSSYQTYGPQRWLLVRACVFEGDRERCPYGPLALVSSNPVDLASLKGRLTITPDPHLDQDRMEVSEGGPSADPYVSLPGRYQPGVEYKVQLAAGAIDEFGQKAPAFEGAAATDDLEPSFDAGPDVALLEADGDGALPIVVTNLARVEGDIYPVDAAGMARLLKRPVPQGRGVHVSLDVSGHKNVVRTLPLDVRGALGQRTGFFLARLHVPERRQETEVTVLGQVTDLAVHAKLGATSSVAWVTSLKTGQPVEGARVDLLDGTGTSRYAGTTDADGLARLPGLATALPEESGNEWETPFAVVSARKDGDTGLTLSSWQGGISPGSFDLRTDWEGPRARSTGMVFTERGIYRPGDEVDVKGIVRYRRLGELRSPVGATLAVQVTSSRGTQVWKGEATATPFGTFSTHFPIPADAPLGSFEVAATTVVDGQELSYAGSFRVEEYRAPQFQVDVSTPSTDAIAGDALEASVLARYLFGGAMSGARVHWTVARTSVPFSPPSGQGFVFGPNTWSWNDDAPEAENDTASAGDGLTDQGGALAVHAGKAEAPGGRTFACTVEAEVEDVNRQRVASRAVITVHPASVYAGLRAVGSGFPESGKPFEVELVAVRPDGTRQSGVPISVELRRREWKSIRKKGAGGQWFTESQSEETRSGGCELKSGSGPVKCQLTPTEPGLYVVAAVVTDPQGRKSTTTISVYVTGSGWVSWQRNDTDRIDLVPDKQLYEVGDTARVLVKSPYPQAEALVTVEREGVRTARRIHLSGSATTVDVPLDDSAIPDVFVSVLLVRGRVQSAQGLETGDDPGRPAVRVGYAQLNVARKEKRLTVEVTPDQTEKRPGQKVAVDVLVKDFAGHPARAELAVWAVDEAVLRLTGYTAPDPVEAIHPERGLSVRIGEPLIHLVLRKLYGDKGQVSGGGGGGEGGGGFRANFKTTVLFAPEVVTDASGKAHLEFTLPDNLTTYRIMAVAVGETDRFGSGESKVVVSKPLLALPALPRLLRVGDHAFAGIVVHGRGFSGGAVKVTASAEGLKFDGPTTRTVTVADGKPVEVRFGLTAEVKGTATLRFTVEGGGERDGLEQKIPVVLPVAMETVATYGDTDGKRVEGLVPPSAVRPDVGGLQITLASTVLGGFDEGMRQLVDYPYGCVEQLASRLVPFVALRELYGKFGAVYEAPAADDRQRFIRELLGNDTLEAAGSTDPDAIVRATIGKLQADQLPSGGYGYWPGDSCESTDGSSYAVLALSRAREVGYEVDGAALDRARRYLADHVASGQGQRCEFGSIGVTVPERVFALYVLARTGSPRPSYYSEMYAGRGGMPLYSRAMLADAMFVGKGDRGQARQLLTELLNHAVESPAGVHFEESSPGTYAPSWSSDTRTTGIVLQTLADISPDHPYVSKIGRYLTDVRKGTGRFRNTQEAAFALMALTEVIRTKEAAPTDFTARVLLGEKSLTEAKFAGKSLHVQSAMLPLSALGNDRAPLTFAREGSGVLYYGALLRYAPVELPMTPLDQGIAVQRWFEPYAGGGQSRRFYAGDLVKVRVRVATSQGRSYVAIDVPLPSGLEAVDTQLSTTAALPGARRGSGELGDDYQNADDLDGEDEGDLSPWARGFWSPFDHAENRDDGVVLFADHLPPGIHTATVVARATTPGDFLLKPAQAQEMYRPEVFGRSDGGRLSVIDPAVVAER